MSLNILKHLSVIVVIAFAMTTKAEEKIKKDNFVNVQMMFIEKNMPSSMELYEVPAEQILDVGTYKYAKISDGLPFQTKMRSEMLVKRGVPKYFAMVIKNPTKENKYFYASYHQMRPEEASLGYLLQCLCVNKLFVIPAESYWYRIGSISLSASLFIKETIAVKHNLFGLTEAEVRQKKLDSLLMDKQ